MRPMVTLKGSGFCAATVLFAGLAAGACASDAGVTPNAGAAGSLNGAQNQAAAGAAGNGSGGSGPNNVAGGSGVSGGAGGVPAENAGSSAGGAMGGVGGAPLGSSGAQSGAGMGGSETGGTGSGGTSGGAPKFDPAEVVKLQIIGSSNELGTCWRAFLWQKLQTAGLTNIDFVGAVNQGPDCGVPGYDKDMQGENGNRVTDWEEATVAGWFSGAQPQIVLLHVGGADVLAALPVAGVVESFTSAIEQARLVTPTVEFMNAQHTPMAPAIPGTMELNAAIISWATEHTTAASPITPVDLYTGLDTEVDTTDGVHLNDVGAEKVATRFYEALAPLFGK